MRAAPRRGAMVLRELSSSRKYRRLSLLAKAALPLLWAWTDDQGRIAVQAEELKMTALAAMPECDEGQIAALFEEYADADLGVLYDAAPGRLAFQWKGWHDAQLLRRKQPSELAPPAGMEDDVRRPVDEAWYVAKRDRVQQVREEQQAATKGEKDEVAARLPAPAIAADDAIEMQRGRYSAEQRKWIDEAISLIGAPPPGELAKEYEAWGRQPPANVAAACQAFVVRMLHKDGRSYPYLRGMVRKWDSSEQPPVPREMPEDRMQALQRVLMPLYYSAPRPDDHDGMQRFKSKLVDLVQQYRLQRRQALDLVMALNVEQWFELDVGDVERRIRTAVVALQMKGA